MIRRVHLLKQTLEFSGCVIQHEFIFLFFLPFFENLYLQNGDIINSITSDLIIDFKKECSKVIKYTDILLSMILLCTRVSCFNMKSQLQNRMPSFLTSSNSYKAQLFTLLEQKPLGCISFQRKLRCPWLLGKGYCLKKKEKTALFIFATQKAKEKAGLSCFRMLPFVHTVEWLAISSGF